MTPSLAFFGRAPVSRRRFPTVGSPSESSSAPCGVFGAKKGRGRIRIQSVSLLRHVHALKRIPHGLVLCRNRLFVLRFQPVMVSLVSHDGLRYRAFPEDGTACRVVYVSQASLRSILTAVVRWYNKEVWTGASHHTNARPVQIN